MLSLSNKEGKLKKFHDVYPSFTLLLCFFIFDVFRFRVNFEPKYPGCTCQMSLNGGSAIHAIRHLREGMVSTSYICLWLYSKHMETDKLGIDVK